MLLTRAKSSQSMTTSNRSSRIFRTAARLSPASLRRERSPSVMTFSGGITSRRSRISRFFSKTRA